MKYGNNLKAEESQRTGKKWGGGGGGEGTGR